MSSFVQLFRRRGLPKGATLDMARALDRRLRGEKLWGFDADDANRLLGLLESEAAARLNVDWDLRDSELREKARSNRGTSSRGTAGSARPPISPAARPGAGSLPAQRPHGGGSGDSAAGAGALLPARRTSMDARHLSDEEYRQLLNSRGYDTGFYESHNSPHPSRPSTPLALAQDTAQRRAAAAQAARTGELEAGRLDARSEKDPTKVGNRLRQILGPNADQSIVESFRPGGEPTLKPPDLGPDPMAAALEARRRAERRARAAAKSGKPVDTKKMDDATFAAFLRLRGLSPGR